MATQRAPRAPALAYYRVSTQRQGRSGLGLEAQRESVERFAEREGARKHWAAVSRSGPAGRAPDFSRPEPAGRWIVQSVSRILASLSPPRW
jgi:hypothetical protein